MSLKIFQAIDMLACKGKTAADDYQRQSWLFTLKSINPIAVANLLEGAFGLRQDALVGGKSGFGRNGIGRKIKENVIKMVGEEYKKIDPSLLKFEWQEGPATMNMIAHAAKMVDFSHNDAYMGITADMILIGLWNPKMLPGGDAGFADTKTQSYWYSTGRQFADRIRSGKFKMKDIMNLTSKAIRQHASKIKNYAGRRNQDEVSGAEMDDYMSGTSATGESLSVVYFDALDDPNHQFHNRAKEFWDQAIAPSLGPNVIGVFQAFRYLGATPSGGIVGGYQAAADWINDRKSPNERPISTKGVKKAWEKVKKQFAVRFSEAKDDPQWQSLWSGLSDAAGISSSFSQNRGRQRAIDDRHEDFERYASIADRHAYRLVLRQRTAK
tara:strand:- start:3892 stop:5037 length:1146 start_codon:yes stop_codon:yes gene_type:complete